MILTIISTILVSLLLLYICVCVLEIIKTAKYIYPETYVRPNRVVVSMTTLPSRMDQVQNTIQSILNNTVQPDAIYINIPLFSKREQKYYMIPSYLENIPKVIINNIKEDFGPASKLIPTLEKEKDPETIIITIDDDFKYDATVIDHLLNCSNQFPDKVICVSGWNYINLRVILLPIFYKKKKYKPRKVKILQGYCGVIYKRKFFYNDIRQYIPCEECFTTDDIYISRYLGNIGIQILEIPHTDDKISQEYSTNKFALGTENLSGNKWIKCVSVKTCGAIK
jgi:hypothetical protein